MVQQSRRIFRLFIGGDKSMFPAIRNIAFFVNKLKQKYSFVTRTNTLLVVIIIIIHTNLYRMLQ